VTTVSEAQAIVAAADAWLLKNLTTHTGVFSHTVNGRTTTLRSYDEVVKLKEHYEGVIRRLSKRRRTYARFDP